MKPANFLVIMSDEHNPKVLGSAGHPIIETPNLDALAARGTNFTNTYTTSPVCIPARAGFACGKYINQIGFWDNADAYDGSIPSWHHILRERGYKVSSIGKLHFRKPDEDHGFTEEQIPMHILGGKGDLMGLIRDDLPKRGGAKKMAALAGPGESQYTFYDKEICSKAQIWLHEEAEKESDKPWVLFVSFVAPHFPLTAPPEHYYKYWGKDLPMPRLYAREDRPMHPYLEDYRNSFCYDDYFENPNQVKRALAGYFGLVSYLDENIGKILKTLNEVGLSDTTNIIYTSDHGDNLGARGLWGKSTMFEEIAGVPLIMAGPSVPKGLRISTPVSHIDCFPTILEGVGVDFNAVKDGHLGVSLFEIADGYKPDRTVLSEYHGMGSTTGAFAIRNGKWKYVYYPKYPAQLFDLEVDPDEINDLGADPTYSNILIECHQKLCSVCDPNETDRRAKARQAKNLSANGGREAVIAIGDIGFTPAPGAAADFL
ncbi:AslA Arylsulfatase A and related enzymes [Burkholderiaceae bacterium]|jgi:choline-sulfatase